MAATRGNNIVPPVLAGEEDAVTQREPRHHLMVGIPSLTQTAGMRGVSGLASKCFARLYIWGCAAENRREKKREKRGDAEGEQTEK